MTLSIFFCGLLISSIFILMIMETSAHGLMRLPNQRGSLRRSKYVPYGTNSSAPEDYWKHFPAGSKSPRRGSGSRSQRIAAGPAGWAPFKPLDPSFRWRYGVCGDEKGKVQHHMRGGKYYSGGEIVATYPQAGIVRVGLSIASHHNGFIELHLCDVRKCNGEISERCFRDGHCRQLQRVNDRRCQSGRSRLCGPIDRNYPGRWYLPCTGVGWEQWELFGPSGIHFQLPKDLSCDHCVLQWFWSSAHTCNPPGVVEYFDGPDRPQWGSCPGQGGAVGGLTRVQKPCSKNRFAQEYIQCADIRIEAITEKEEVSGVESIESNDTSTPALDTSQSASYSETSTLASPSQMVSPSTSRSPLPSSNYEGNLQIEAVFPLVTELVEPSIIPSLGLIDEKHDIEAMISESPLWSGKAPGESPSFGWNERKNGWKGKFAGRADEKLKGTKRGTPDINERVFKRLVLIGDGGMVNQIHDGDSLDIRMYSNVSIEAITSREVSKVQFYLNGKKVWREFNRPYMIFGNRGRVPHYWRNPIVDVPFELMVEAEGETVVVMMKLVKKKRSWGITVKKFVGSCNVFGRLKFWQS